MYLTQQNQFIHPNEVIPASLSAVRLIRNPNGWIIDSDSRRATLAGMTIHEGPMNKAVESGHPNKCFQVYLRSRCRKVTAFVISR